MRCGKKGVEIHAENNCEKEERKENRQHGKTLDASNNKRKNAGRGTTVVAACCCNPLSWKLVMFCTELALSFQTSSCLERQKQRGVFNPESQRRQ